jgi:glycosyltransferase involved in cell wall biosynthesis
LASCLSQTFGSFEVIVVDDGSTDETVPIIEHFSDPRIKLIRNEENRGMSYSLAVATENASGEWIVRIDSDHSLLENALERFFQLSLKLPSDVGILGACYQWDDGKITPLNIPGHILDYEGRIRWVEEGGGSDYVSCIRRCVFDVVHWSSRRGSGTALLQYDLARYTKALIVDETLAMEYTDMLNSYHRATRVMKLQQRIRNALDQAITYDEILVRHGAALEKYGPRQLKFFLLMSAFNYFLAGVRRKGIHKIARFLRLCPLSIMGWALLITGLLGPQLVGWAYLRKKPEWR